jgi:hypothetical protein
MIEDDRDFVENSDAVNAFEESSGLEDEAATLADGELEDEQNRPMDGENFRLDRALGHAESDGDAGYDDDTDYDNEGQ